MDASEKAWFLESRDGNEKPWRLFCFPFAGGSAALFNGWRSDIDPRIHLIATQLPGRGARIREPLIERMDVLVETLVDAMAARLGRPFALFGHSMGALVTFEVARSLRRRKLPMPAAMFVSARRAPQLPPRMPFLHTLSDDALIAELRALNGTPDAVLEDKELLDLMLPIIRADLTAVERHDYRDEPPLDCPIIVFGGWRDNIARDDLLAWSEQSREPLMLQMFDGDHFFLNEKRPIMLRMIADALLNGDPPLVAG